MKNFVQCLAVLLAAVLLVGTSHAQPQPQLLDASEPDGRFPGANKPNIIFILVDDMDIALADYMPNLKKLMVKQCTSFTNAFANVSLCCPSRATILRGQYSQNTKIFGNYPESGGFETFHKSNVEKSTIATWLEGAGYRTMLVGKYLNGYPNIVGENFIPPGWTEWYAPVKGDAYKEYNYTLNENGKLVNYGSNEKDYGTDVYNQKTIKFIQASVKQKKPFFAYVSLYKPHSPYVSAPRHASLFADAQLPRPLNFNEEDVRDKPAYIKNQLKLTLHQIKLTEKAYRNKLRTLQAIDEMIKDIVDELKISDQIDNTYIFFLSDNGFHLGNHRLPSGKRTPYEEDIRVPFIVRGPGIPANTKIHHIVGNVDLAPTWADLAEVKIPKFVDGRSLVPLLISGENYSEIKSNPGKWRNSYLISLGRTNPEYEILDSDNDFLMSPREMQGLLEPPDELSPEAAGLKKWSTEPPAHPFQGLRTLRYKYVEYKTKERELYDLLADPYELNNLAKTANGKMLNELSTRLRNLKNCSGQDCRNLESLPWSCHVDPAKPCS